MRPFLNDPFRDHELDMLQANIRLGTRYGLTSRIIWYIMKREGISNGEITINGDRNITIELNLIFGEKI